jgi:RNA polymerase sigma-70 factor (ECF subfamily)
LPVDIDQYYRKYGAMVFRRCRQMLGDESRAQDAVQEVFISLLKNNARIQDEFPSSLLYRMATNICLNIIKKEKNVSLKDDTFFNGIAGKDDFSESLEAQEVLTRIFAGEKTDMMSLAVMRYVDKLNYEEISEISGLSVSGVRKRLRKLSEKAEKLKADIYD